MASETTATFIGHNECFEISKEQVINTIQTLIKQGVTDFLCGGQGGVDHLCGRCVYELTKRVSTHKQLPCYSLSLIQCI